MNNEPAILKKSSCNVNATPAENKPMANVKSFILPVKYEKDKIINRM